MSPLNLRFTEAETSDAPPDLAAFTAVDPALLREQAADHDDKSPLADLVTADLVASHLRVIVDDEPALRRHPVFVTLRSTPIPAPSPHEAPARPADFVLTDRVRGHFAWPARPGAPSLALAACLPLVVPDVALAQAPVRRPTAAATAPAATSPAPAAPATVVPPSPDPFTAPTSLPPAPVVAPPPPRISSPANTLETILRAMNGREAVIYAGGVKVSGLIVGVEGDFVTIVNEEADGKIAMIPKAQIAEVRGKMKPRMPADLPTGVGGIVGGSILIGVGAPLMLSGLVFLGITPSYVFIYLPQILPAGVMLGAGIPLLIRGIKNRRIYNARLNESRLSERLAPSFGRTPGGGWTGGLSLRF